MRVCAASKSIHDKAAAHCHGQSMQQSRAVSIKPISRWKVRDLEAFLPWGDRGWKKTAFDRSRPEVVSCVVKMEHCNQVSILECRRLATMASSDVKETQE